MPVLAYLTTDRVPVDWRLRRAAAIELRVVTPEEARELRRQLLAAGYREVNTIRHASTWQPVRELLGVENDVEFRQEVWMTEGDAALAFVLLSGLPYGRELTAEELRRMEWRLVYGRVASLQ